MKKYSVFYIAFAVFIFFFYGVLWCRAFFGLLPIEQIIFFLVATLKGTEPALFILFFITAGVGWIVTIVMIFGILRYFKQYRRFFTLFCVFIMFYGVFYLEKQYGVIAYISNRMRVSTFYEENYASPKDVIIRVPQKKRNLIVIFAESMESTYQHFKGNNYIPNLSRIAENNISFTNFKQGYRQGWTQGALFSAMTGMVINVAGNKKTDGIISRKNTALSDILNTNGYENLFVQGGDINFTDTRMFLKSHSFKDENIFGRDEISARFNVKKEQYGVWGIDDTIVFKVFKEILNERLKSGSPYFAVLFTTGTHPVFRESEEERLKKYRKSDYEIASFIKWLEIQEFYKDTVLVIIGDHYRAMDNIKKDNTVIYNVFINTGLETENADRFLVQTDMFPTLLESIGFKVNGGRLGIGTSLFSKKDTFAEIYGMDEFNRILGQRNRLYDVLCE